MPETVSDDDVQYALGIVRTICSEVGPGVPGSPQERERAAIIQRELESHLGAEKVAVEEFTFAPTAFLRSSPIISLLILLAALLNISTGRLTGVSVWLTCIAALVLSVISPLLFLLEFYFGLELTDPLFKKGQSVNVVGRLRKPGTRGVRRLLVLSWSRAARQGPLQGEGRLHRSGERCGPLQSGGTQGHDTGGLYDEAAGSLLPPEVGWAGSADHRAAAERAQARSRVDTRRGRIGKKESHLLEGNL